MNLQPNSDNSQTSNSSRVIEPWPFFIVSGGQDHYEAWANNPKLADPWIRFKHAVSMALAEMQLPGCVWVPATNKSYVSVWDSNHTHKEQAWYARNWGQWFEAVDKATRLALKLVPEITIVVDSPDYLTVSRGL